MATRILKDSALAMVFAVFILGAGTAGAATPDALREAAGLNDEAVVLYGDGAFGAAADKFDAAYGLSAEPGVLYNWARALHRGGELAAAKARYAELEATFPGYDAGKLSKARGYLVEIDGVLAAEKAKRAAADSAKALELAAKEEALAAERALILPSKPLNPPEAAAGGGINTAGWVIFGVGVVGAGVGVGLMVAAEGKRGSVSDVISDALTADPLTPAVSTDVMTLSEARTLRADADLFTTIGTAALIAGGALAVTGLIMGLVDDGNGVETRESVHLGIAPMASGGAFLSMDGRF